MMAEQKIKVHVPASNDDLDKKLDTAVEARLRLEQSVEEIAAIVHADGGLVYQCDLKDLKNENTMQHNMLIGKVDELAPLITLVAPLQEMVKNQEAMQRGSKWLVGTLSFVALLLGICFTVYKAITGRW